MSNPNTKRLIKNTGFLYIRMVIMMLISLYTSRVVLKILGVEDFGIYNVVGGVVTMFSFINGAMALATQRFLSFELGKGSFVQLKRVFSMSVTIHILIAIIIMLLAETIGLWLFNTQLKLTIERREAAFWVYQFSVLACVITVLQVPYNASLISHEKMNIYAYISLVEASLRLILVFILIYFVFDKLILYSILMFLVSTLIAFFYFIYTRWKYEECHIYFFWDKNLFKILISYASLSLFGNMATVFVNQGQNILLNIFFGPVVNAARGIAFSVNAAISAFVNNFLTAVNPQIIKSYASNNIEYMNKLIFQSSKFSFFLLYLISLPVLIETKFVLTTWLNIVPDNTVIFCRLVLINALLGCIITPLVIAIQATGKIKALHLITGSINLFNLPISYFLLKMSQSPEIVFYIQIIITIILNLSVLLIQKKQLNFSIWLFCKKVIFPAFFIAFLASLIPIYMQLHMQYGYIRFITVSGLSGLLMCLLVYSLGIDSQFRNQLKQKNLRKLLRKQSV